MVPVELHHGLEREIADHVTVEDEERVCSLGEQVAGQSQGPGWGRGEDSIFLGLNPWIQAQEASPRPSLPSSLTLNPLPKNFLPLLTCPQRFLFMGHGDSDSKLEDRSQPSGSSHEDRRLGGDQRKGAGVRTSPSAPAPSFPSPAPETCSSRPESRGSRQPVGQNRAGRPDRLSRKPGASRPPAAGRPSSRRALPGPRARALPRPALPLGAAGWAYCRSPPGASGCLVSAAAGASHSRPLRSTPSSRPRPAG